MKYLLCSDCVILAYLENQCSLVAVVRILVGYFQIFLNIPLLNKMKSGRNSTSNKKVLK